MKIGELARGAGTTTKTIRFYELQGLLPDPLRSASGYRAYGPDDVERLEFIGRAKRLGLSLEEIGGVLQLNDRGEPTCVHVRALLDEKIRRLEQVVRDFSASLKGVWKPSRSSYREPSCGAGVGGPRTCRVGASTEEQQNAR